MYKRKYENYSKDQLLEKIKQLEKHRYGLVWEDKQEDVAEFCESALPVLHEITTKEIATARTDDAPVNILIEGDNYHSLFVLNFTHRRKVDLIYMDPPYNTGAKDWKYNNDYVDSNDRWRHSKWISMMHKRLLLAKQLLTENGIIVCAIDEYEIHNLRHLFDRIFGEQNKLGMVTVLHNPKGRNLAKFFSANSEFMLVYAKDINRAKFNDVAIDEEVLASFDLSDSSGRFRLEPFMRIRSSWTRKKKPRCWYPIYVSKDLGKITLEKEKGYYEIYPTSPDGREMAWKNVPETFKKLNDGGYFVAKEEEGMPQIYHKYHEQQVFKNVWTNKKYQSEFHGTNLLKTILGENSFSYPKSLYLIMDILKIATNKKSIVLDFFAGSGTTGHAVLELNQQDGGMRQFILCTNNENGICEEICFPRIKKVIKGYEGSIPIPANLKYFKTDFVPQVLTDNDKRVLVNRSTELLCVAENTFDPVKQSTRKADFAIYKNYRQHTAIIYEEDAIQKCLEFLESLKPQTNTVIYVFSYDHEYDQEDFINLNIPFTVKPIPEAILNVYRKNAKLRRR
jgi:adenine-specific DNA-methyltransferase